MKTTGEFYSAVDAIVARPAMYFGERPGYLREIVGFGLGVDFQSRSEEKPEASAMDAFVRYVCDRLPIGRSEVSAWSARIDDSVNSESEAWHLFAELWASYRNEIYKPDRAIGSD